MRISLRPPLVAFASNRLIEVTRRHACGGDIERSPGAVRSVQPFEHPIAPACHLKLPATHTRIAPNIERVVVEVRFDVAHCDQIGKLLAESLARDFQRRWLRCASKSEPRDLIEPMQHNDQELKVGEASKQKYFVLWLDCV